MTPNVFQDDSAKVSVIRGLLRQAEEMMGGVETHLSDYGERLPESKNEPNEQQRIEIQHLQQDLFQKEDEVRTLRTERVSLANEIERLRGALKIAEERSAQSIAKRVESETDLEKQVRLANDDVKRLTVENEKLRRRLQHAHTHMDDLLRQREGMLDLVKLSDVRVSTPRLPVEIEEPAPSEGEGES